MFRSPSHLHLRHRVELALPPRRAVVLRKARRLLSGAQLGWLASPVAPLTTTGDSDWPRLRPRARLGADRARAAAPDPCLGLLPGCRAGRNAGHGRTEKVVYVVGAGFGWRDRDEVVDRRRTVPVRAEVGTSSLRSGRRRAGRRERSTAGRPARLQATARRGRAEA